MNNEKLTIEALFSDSGPFDEDAVVRALLPHIVIQKPDNEIFFKDTKLSAKRKMLAYALAKKLLKRASLVNDESVTAPELHQKTGIKKGTIDPMLKALREEGLFAGKKEYEIPSYKVQEAISMINEEV
jgi:transcription initiation factor IIE alpha subunit